MGSATLKTKSNLHYRRGTTAHHCSECNSYFPEFDVRGIGGELIRSEPRCRVMGLKDGRAYRIMPGNICDAHDNSDYIKRLRG